MLAATQTGRWCTAKPADLVHSLTGANTPSLAEAQFLLRKAPFSSAERQIPLAGKTESRQTASFLEQQSRPNQEWSIDFVTDALANGRAIRSLTVLDDFTKESLAIEVDTSLSGLRVTRVLDRIIAERWKPGGLRLDNGPEFTSRCFIAWA